MVKAIQMIRKRRCFSPLLATIVLLAITMSVTLGETILVNQNRGAVIPMARALEEELVKEVGDLVSFRVKVQNTGNKGTGYLVYVMVCEHGTGEWDNVGLEDIWLESDQYEHLELGNMEVSEWMVGKYFDVQFLLYDHETEILLDSVVIESAWYVPEPIIAGSIIGQWVY